MSSDHAGQRGGPDGSSDRRDVQDAARHRAGARWKDTGLVFSTKWGSALLAGNVRRSLLSDSGVRLEDIVEIVGHAGTTVTEKVYRHQLRPVLLTGAIAMDDIFKAEESDAGAVARRRTPVVAGVAVLRCCTRHRHHQLGKQPAQSHGDLPIRTAAGGRRCDRWRRSPWFPAGDQGDGHTAGTTTHDLRHHYAQLLDTLAGARPALPLIMASRRRPT